MTNKSFDPYEWKSFYFGKMSREEAIELLTQPHVEAGTFLIRDSSREGEYSLSVRELIDLSDPKKGVRHYLIQQSTDDELNRCIRVASQCFEDIPAMLNYYKMRILENCSLTVPYMNETVSRMVGKWRFHGECETDLSFAPGEELDVLGVDDEGWLRARNAIGKVGRVPADYLEEMEPEPEPAATPEPGSGSEVTLRLATRPDVDLSTMQPYEIVKPGGAHEVPLPCWGRVRFTYTASIFDADKISVRKGDTVYVTELLPSGWARGQVYRENRSTVSRTGTASRPSTVPKEGGVEGGREEADAAHEKETEGGDDVISDEINSAYWDDQLENTKRSQEGLFPASSLIFLSEDGSGLGMQNTSKIIDWFEASSIDSSDSMEAEYERRESARERNLIEGGIF